jgi:hypothetical protein
MNPVNMSVVLQAAAFKVSFQILPSAQPFTVAAVGEAGSAIISIDPASGTFTGSGTVPTALTMQGDFNLPGFPTIFDWYGCDAVTGTCQPFPENIFPENRIDPNQFEVEQSLPTANSAVPNSATGLFQSSGSAVPGTTFTIDGTDSSSSTFSTGVFGAWLLLPWGPFATHESTLQLFVDGQAIASTTVTYDLMHR